MKILFTILLCFSCTITRSYKVKDIKKGYFKNLKVLEKASKESFKYVKNVEEILESLRFEQAPSKLLIEQEKIFNQIKKYDRQLIADLEDYKKEYYKLKLKEKRILSSNKKRFAQINRYIDLSKSRLTRMNKENKLAQQLNQRFIENFKKHGFTYIKTSQVKGQFLKIKKRFAQKLSYIRKDVKAFSIKVKRHKNYLAIKEELSEVSTLLSLLEKDFVHIEGLVKKFDRVYAKREKLIYGPNSKVYKGFSAIEMSLKNLNLYQEKLNKQQRRINQLLAN